MSSHPSSGFLSARRRHHEELKQKVEQELKQTQTEKERAEEAKRRAAEEAERLRRSIEANKAALLGKVNEVRSSAEVSDGGVMRVSKNSAPLRDSTEDGDIIVTSKVQ